MSRLANSNKK